jgi:hypothetical protein
MVRSPEPPGEHPSLDEVSAERLLRGQRPASGAPAGEQAVYELLAAASAPPTARELSGEARAVAAFTATRPATTGPRHARHVIRRRRPAVRPRVGHGVAAAAALGALTLGGVAAAAYTGSLPSSIQRLAHDHIGAPHGDHPGSHLPDAVPSRPKPTGTALRSGRPGGTVGQPGLSAITPTTPRPSPSGPGRRPNTTPISQRLQLCTAYVTARVRGDTREADRAFRRLENAAGGRDNVWAYCEPVWGGGDHSTSYPGPHDSNYPDPWPQTTPETANGRPPN